MIKHKILILLALFVILFCACKGDDPGNNLSKDEEKVLDSINSCVVLTINTSTFKNKDFKDFIKTQYSSISEQNQSDTFRSRIFDKFIDHKLIMYKVKKENLQVSQEEISEYLNEHNIPLAEADNRKIIENLLLQKYLFFTVYKDIEVATNEIRRYYTDNQDKFKKRQEIKLYQILVKNKDKANQIWDRLNTAPQKFAEIAEKESQSTEAIKKGFMGFFEKGILPLEMEEVVFSLKLNTISPVTKSPYGYHIFKVTQNRNRRTQYLSKVSDRIKRELLSQKLNQAYHDFLQSLKGELNVTINQKNLFFKYQTIIGE